MPTLAPLVEEALHAAALPEEEAAYFADGEDDPSDLYNE
jgi:hypothetical protein